MGSKHRRQDSPRNAMRVMGLGAGLTFTALATFGAAQQVTAPTEMSAAATAPLVAQVQATPVQEQGRVVALSPTSVTTVGEDGRERTFFVTAETTAVTPEGAGNGSTVLPFAVNDEVSIVGEVRNGTPFATAVAAREVADGSGPPMDYALP